MAELDLSEIWLKSKRIDAKDQIDIDAAISSKSKDTLHWIKIILFIELGLNIVLAPLIYFWWKSEGLIWQFYVLTGIIVVYVFYYLFLIKEINSFDYSDQIKSSLIKIHKYLDFYLLHYKVIIWVIFPASYFYGLYLGLTTNGKELADISTNRWLILIGVSIVVNVIAIYSSLKLINMIYGKKISRLQDMIKELETEELA